MAAVAMAVLVGVVAAMAALAGLAAATTLALALTARRLEAGQQVAHAQAGPPAAESHTHSTHKSLQPSACE